MQDQAEVPVSGAGCLVRLGWMLFGNLLLFFLLVSIPMKRPAFPSAVDAACMATVVLLIAIRYVDIRYFSGLTGDGKPATMTHWRRYALVIGAGGTGAWILARALEYYLK